LLLPELTFTPDVAYAGTAFPMGPDSWGGLALARDEVGIDQSIQLLLDTAPGERPLREDFGCEAYWLEFETVDTATLNAVETAIRDAIERWEPRVAVLNVDFDVSRWQEGSLTASIAYRVHRTRDLRTILHRFRVEERELATEDDRETSSSPHPGESSPPIR
jgi:phage baseplate assembly protein W